jgi:hypothetical protein
VGIHDAGDPILSVLSATDRRLPPLPDHVDRAVARNRGEPGHGLAGVRRVRARVLPDPQEGVLKHLLGHGPVPDDTQDDAEEFWGSRVVEGLEGAPVPAGDSRDQRSEKPALRLATPRVALAGGS